MKKFMQYYSLEIYTVTSLLLIMYSTIFVSPDVIQKMALVFTFIFMLHEWEECFYPGGFSDIVSGIILGETNSISQEQTRASRVFTGIYLICLTFIPYFAHAYAWLILPAVFLGILEGFVHIAATKAFGNGKPYTPGFITAECELVTSIYVIWYLISHHLVTPLQFILALVLCLAGFMSMQRILVKQKGLKYRDLPKIAKQNIKLMKERKMKE